MKGAEFGKKPEFVKAVVYGGLLAVAMAVLGLVEGCATHERAQQEGVSPAQPTNATVLPASRPELPPTADSGTPRTATVERGSQGRAEARRPEVERSSPAHPGPRMTAPRSASKPPAFAALRSESSVASMAPPGSLPSPEEELWVIARNEPALPPEAEQPGSGAMLARPEPGQEVPMALKHTDVKATISAYIATVSVTQQFQNPYDRRIEAVYLFPLPHNAAVNDFVMTIGERRIRAIIRQRKEAEEIYREAKRQGYLASLLTAEQHSNSFSVCVGNLAPGKEIDTCIQYVQTLDYCDGWYEFAFPLRTPRAPLNPPHGAAIPSAAPGQTVAIIGSGFTPAHNSAQFTEDATGHFYDINGLPSTDGGTRLLVTVPPGAPPGPYSLKVGALNSDWSRALPFTITSATGTGLGSAVSLRVDVDAGVTIEQFECPTHAVLHDSPSPHRLTVSLAPAASLSDRDFLLRYRVAGTEVKAGLLTHRDVVGGYFTLMLYPPMNRPGLPPQPTLTQLKIDWGAFHPSEVFPSELPGLAAGPPVVLTGRFAGDPKAHIRITGSAAGKPAEMDVRAVHADAPASHPALPFIWARAKLARLTAQSAHDPSANLAPEIQRLALDYGLVSAWTAFLAVDASQRTQGQEGAAVPAAVPVADGVRYKTTVQEKP